MTRIDDLSRSLAAFDQDSTLVCVVELASKTWLVGASVPGIERRPMKKIEPAPERLLALITRWRGEARDKGRDITRVVVAYETGRDGFWLARWLMRADVEVHVIHAASVAVSREAKRAKTDSLDLAMLFRVLVGWLRGERDHCRMVAIPSEAEEDARRPSRERETLVAERARITNRMQALLVRFGIRGFKPMLRGAAERLERLCTAEGAPLPANALSELNREFERLAMIKQQIATIEKERLTRLEAGRAEAPEDGPDAMVRLLARVIGIGIETADLLVREVLSRPWRDRRALARYAGLTGSPDESGEGDPAGPRLPLRQGPGRQRPRATRHDRAGLALPVVPGRQRPGALVSRAHARRLAHATQDHDHGAGPQAVAGLVAADRDRRDAGGTAAAPGLRPRRAWLRQEPERDRASALT